MRHVNSSRLSINMTLGEIHHANNNIQLLPDLAKTSLVIYASQEAKLCLN